MENNKSIKDLTKEELILVIAEMYDSIQDWYGYGYSSEDVKKLEKIGNLATEVAYKNGESRINLSDIVI